MFQRVVELPASTRGLHDITARLVEMVRAAGVQTGLCHVFLQHTSASLVIQENADPAVHYDLLGWMERMAPDGDPRYRHVDEGPDDMSAHLRSAITATSLTIPVVGGDLGLGTWQGIYLFEHRTRSHRRRLVVSILE